MAGSLCVFGRWSQREPNSTKSHKEPDPGYLHRIVMGCLSDLLPSSFFFGGGQGRRDSLCHEEYTSRSRLLLRFTMLIIVRDNSLMFDLLVSEFECIQNAEVDMNTLELVKNLS